MDRISFTEPRAIRKRGLAHPSHPDESVAKALGNMIEKRQHVESVLSSSNMDPDELAEASREMEEAEKRQEEEKGWEIPQELENFRESWKEKIKNIGDESKEKIIKAAENIPVKVEIDGDGSRLIELKL